MSEHREKFLKLIEEIANGGNRYTVFNDFCKMSALSISQKLNFDQRREDLYLAIVNKYNREAVSNFIEMFWELAAALEDCIAEKVLRVNCPPLEAEGVNVALPLKGSNPHYEDFLGDIFTEMNQHDRKEGQVFTPAHIGNIMGELTLTEDYAWGEIKRQGFIVIRENCCGSGAITLNAMNRLLDLNISPNYQTLVVASDTDERCVYMCYLQLSLYGIPAVVLQQNDITDEVYDEWYTPLFVKNNWQDKFDWRRARATEKQLPRNRDSQGRLFDDT